MLSGFCHYSGDQFHVLVPTTPTASSYSVKPMCVETQDRGEMRASTSRRASRAAEHLASTWCSEQSPADPTSRGGRSCLDTDTADEFDVITPGKVFKEMQKLAWPEAEMVIQPPDGRTLVNLETNFLTTTTEPTTQSVQLLGHGGRDRGDAGELHSGTSATAQRRTARTRERRTRTCGSPTSTSRPG